PGKQVSSIRVTFPETGSDGGKMRQEQVPAPKATLTTPDGQINLPINGAPIIFSTTFNLKPDTEYNWRVRTSKTPPPSSTVIQGTIKKVKSWFSSDEDNEQTDLEWDEWGPIYTFKTMKMEPVLKSPVGLNPDSRVSPQITLQGTKAYPWGAEFKWKTVE